MKTLKTLLIVLVFGLTVIGCGKDNDNRDRYYDGIDYGYGYQDPRYNRNRGNYGPIDRYRSAYDQYYRDFMNGNNRNNPGFYADFYGDPYANQYHLRYQGR